MRSRQVGILIILAIAGLAACDAAISVGGRTVGLRGGKFLYSDGFVLAKYPHPFEKVWEACEKATRDIKASEVEKTLRIGAGQIKARVNDEPVTILVKYIDKNETSVSVRVGLMGNALASQMFLDRIAKNF